MNKAINRRVGELCASSSSVFPPLSPGSSNSQQLGQVPHAGVRGHHRPHSGVRGHHRPQHLGIKPIRCSTSPALSHDWNLGSPVSLCTHPWSPILFSRCQMMSLRWGRVAVVLGGGPSGRTGWGKPQEADPEARQGGS